MNRHNDRITELDNSRAANSRDWQMRELDHAIAYCEELLRRSDLDNEQRMIAENQLQTFRQLRSEI